MSWNKKTNGELVKLADLGSGGGGGNANIWYGSHAEYEEEKTTIEDGTQVCFTDDVGIEAESDYYSEVEQVIGTYLGKPLYRRVVDYGNGSSTTGAYVYKAHEISNIENIFKVYGYIKFASGQFSALPFVSTSNLNSQVSIVADATNVGYMSGVSRATDSFIFVIEYTKTTDSVVGVIGGIKKGDNYSTNEQVIGTWINGKPLYRKSISFTPTPTSQTISLNIDNIDICVMVPYASYVFYNNVYRNLPYSHTSDGGSISAWISKVNRTCDIRYGNDYSGITFTSGLITVMYTKITD